MFQTSNSGFIAGKPIKPKIAQKVDTRLKRKRIVDFLMTILGTKGPENPTKPEIDEIGRNQAQMKDNSRLSNQIIRNHMVLTSTSGFSAENGLIE